MTARLDAYLFKNAMGVGIPGADERGVDLCVALGITAGDADAGMNALHTVTAEQLAAEYGVAFLYRDFRPGFREGQRQARELGFYMQKYCGCIFSEEDRYSTKIEKAKKRYAEE